MKYSLLPLLVVLSFLNVGFGQLIYEQDSGQAVYGEENSTGKYGRDIFGLASPIELLPGQTKVFIDDYFDSIFVYDRIILPTYLTFSNYSKDRFLQLEARDSLNPIDLLSIGGNGVYYSVPVIKSTKVKVDFEFNTNDKYESVALVGDLNAWNAANTPLENIDGKWMVSLYLEPGIYQYKLVVDGKWILDPNNPEKLDNGIGDWNSKLVVESKNEIEIPRIFTSKIGKNYFEIEFEGEIDGVVALWNNFKVTPHFVEGKYRFNIPKYGKEVKRSYFRVWAFNKGGVSNRLLIPLEYGKILTNPMELEREDKEADIIYFMMVDRFANGDKENDLPMTDVEVLPKADFYGGDLKGITDKLEEGYFEDLGVNTLWLSPIIKNVDGKWGLFDKGGVKTKFSSYHGYWPTSFTKINRHFGDATSLYELTILAHEFEKNIILDFVANHVHESHPVYQANKNNGWATDLYLPDGSLNTERWDDHRLTTWFDTFLPTLNLEKQEVTEMLSDSAIYWLEDFGIDGFRYDATKHIPLNFWKTLTWKIQNFSRKNAKKILQMGETYGTPELIKSYINNAMLDCQFDFNVYDAMVSSICKKNVGFEELKRVLNQSFDYYEVNHLMGNISGNQDKPRFMALATGDVKFDEDTKLAGWTRDIKLKTEEGFMKEAIMHSILMTIPGIPVIYYGDEIGLTGGNDPDNRRMMKFDGLDSYELGLKEKVSKLTKLRRNNMPFLFGDFTFLKVEKNVMSYSRNYFGEVGIVVINNSAKEKNISVELPSNYVNSKYMSNFNSDFKIEGNTLNIKLKPFSFEVLLNSQK